jgi:multiple sugar transport system ATP-binding protein
MAALALREVSKSYDGTQAVLDRVSLEVEAGEFVVFVGPSGSGKSTLLRLVAGLDALSDGEIHIGGRRADTLPPAQRGIAMVFQSYALYPHMSVFENMAFALRMAGAPKPEIDQRVRRAAQILQIEPLLAREPRALSGGQRQRVAIGRAIVREPQVFLFDEPLSNLDASLRQSMRVELARLHRELGATMVYVTHDQVEAMTLAERIVVFDRGRVQQVGTPTQLYRQPANLFVAGFLGSPRINLVTGRVAGSDAGGCTVEVSGFGKLQVAATAAVGSDVTLGVRPEHWQPAHGEGPNRVQSTVELVEYLGDHQLAYLRPPSGAESLCMKLSANEPSPGVGTSITLAFSPADALLFDAAGAACPRIA